MHLPRIGITPGDPAGIGPDICLQAFQEFEAEAELVFYTNPGLMAARARKLGLEVTIHGESKRGGLQIHSVDLQSIPEPGVPDATSAPFVIDCLGAALEAKKGDNRWSSSPIWTGPEELLLLACHVRSGATTLDFAGKKFVVVVPKTLQGYNNDCGPAPGCIFLCHYANSIE